ncbi:phospholipase D-like domain-containing protein [Sphingomonas prati]|uniref:Phospholipase D n=1 Tax=Sphingomonas prati TaxID=1843237 RepID=A0A7W9BT82_9SPHN|nr:phospholipase D-like domain-containing protein [Sphingomonas prati]MBB5729596.1 phosphatidylserine/phosphatidylglycerophosphate/cardiolipin synthase-like enzyme [Sphingomonas prati]GGE76249.1 phospholipase D/transphosphatidylase [Sphingomonas prati]
MSDPDPATPDFFRPGHNSWCVDQADRFAVVIDAANYFRRAREAMMKAERRIMLVGWDFDARIKLRGEPLEPGEPETVGDFILWLVERKPTLEVYLLRWDMGAIKSLFRGRTIFTLLRWMRHPRIHTKLDGKHPTGASHHQKIVVIDDMFAFCGGIDMTSDRWDDRHHADGNPLRVRPNGTPHPPWHDATSAMSGPITQRFGDMVRHRWMLAGGMKVDAVQGGVDCWPDSLDPDFREVPVAIARTHPDMPDIEPVHEIEQLYLDMIAAARRHIYAESQYFASRRIAEAIVKRLQEPDGPEIVLVNPLTANGWLEPIAMDTARSRLVEAMRKLDPHQRFRIYHPFTRDGEAIYVHAKVMIVDEHMIRVGSSNMNNRSLRLDTECDVAVDLRADEEDPRRARIGAIRNSLIAEHLGAEQDKVADHIQATGSLIATIEALRGPGRSLRPYETPDLGTVEKWLADNEILDPEGPGEMFEGLSKRGLFRRANAWRAARRERRGK